MIEVDPSEVRTQNIFCFALGFSCGGKNIPAEELSDIKASQESKQAITFLFLMMLPGIFIISLVLYAFKAFVLALIATVVGLVLAKLLRFELNLNSSFAIACYSLTVLLVPQVVAKSMGIDTLGLELPMFAVLFVAAILVSSKKGDTHGHRRNSENKHTGKGTA